MNADVEAVYTATVQVRKKVEKLLKQVEQLREVADEFMPQALGEIERKVERLQGAHGQILSAHRKELDDLLGRKADADGPLLSGLRRDLRELGTTVHELRKQYEVTEEMGTAPGQLGELRDQLARCEAHVKHSIGADVQQLQQQSTGHEQAQRAHDERLDSQALTLSSQSFQLDRHQKEIEELRARVQLLIDHAARAEPPAEVS